MYELLMDIGTAGMQRGLEYDVVIADFGGGWYASATLDSNPIRTWSLTWAGTYNDPYQRPVLVQARLTDGSKFGTPVSRPKYLQDFFTRRMTNGNDPFYIADPFEPGNPLQPTYWLARLDLTSINFQQSDETQRWSYGVKIKGARVPGVPQQVTPSVPFPP